MTPADGDLRIELAGQSMWLLAERAAFWEEERTLFIADPHWGKAATFRAAGIPVPEATTGNGVARLKAIVKRTGARRIVFLGDFLHAAAGRSAEVLAALSRWRAGCPDLGLLLVRGNHDLHAGDPPGELLLECVDAPHVLAPFILSHHPIVHADGHVLAGHVHPAAQLRGAGRESMRLPCFFIGARSSILPAFGDFTGYADINPGPGDRVFVVTAEKVMRID